MSEPWVCGEDFCEKCGDCLYCYGSEPCALGGAHEISEDDVAEEQQ